MPPAFLRSLRLRRLARAGVLWLLALVVPLQCGAALARAAAGPVHVHAAAADGAATPPLLLDDVRRGLAVQAGLGAPATAPLLAAIAHGHRHAERHHHFAGSAGLATPEGRALDLADAGDDGGTASSGAFAGLVPLVGALPAWRGARTAEAVPASRAWAASWHVATPLERPPRGSSTPR